MTKFDMTHSPKLWLTAFSCFLALGAGLLLWDTFRHQEQSETLTTINHPKTAGPVAAKPALDNVNLAPALPSPKQIQTKEKRTIKLAAGDSLSSILTAQGVSNRQIYQLTQADTKEAFKKLNPNDRITITLEQPNAQLLALTLEQDIRQYEVFTAQENHFSHKTIQRAIDVIPTYKEARIESSLFVDGSNAGIADKLLFQLASIFKWDIDFALDIRRGDAFAILYEEQYIDGEAIGTGNILAAEFINNGRYFEAIRYQTERRIDYFTADGLSLRKAFIRTPVDFNRISSRFNPNRLHPIFKTTQPHRGVDYAASEGTPVQSSGDGEITYAGDIRGYGNAVIIDHGRGYTTLYAHLQGFAPNIKTGYQVSQGEEIGYVGQTGWATGPHLHYEFRVNGIHQNPETIAIPNDSPMSKDELTVYLRYAQSIKATLQRSHSAMFKQALSQIRR
ncbi:peptidase M23 [Marinomonas piezotolerans]|uniref:Peptidase M23 n=2 Tax=Marinomonas piezotolerans TaxID=2213058 RepID=A0A370U4I1_9GAMM|nr:peptidase M23 [Marinomonas piezotolerans]